MNGRFFRFLPRRTKYRSTRLLPSSVPPRHVKCASQNFRALFKTDARRCLGVTMSAHACVSESWLVGLNPRRAESSGTVCVEEYVVYCTAARAASPGSPSPVRTAASGCDATTTTRYAATVIDRRFQSGLRQPDDVDFKHF